jgi:hypothetical protein
MSARAQAEALQVIERTNAIVTAARASVLSAFTSGQGYSADAHYSLRAWLIHQTRVTKVVAVAHTEWALATSRCRCTSCIPRPETDVPAAVSSPARHAARRRAVMPRTWPARIAAADRRGLLTWPCCAARETHTVITNPGVTLQGSPLQLRYSAWFVIRSLPVCGPGRRSRRWGRCCATGARCPQRSKGR